MSLRKAYQEALFSAEWIAFSSSIKDRDNFICRSCNKNIAPLHAHHRYYVRDRLPWEYPDSAVITLCSRCHAKAHFARIPSFNEGDLELLKLEDIQEFRTRLEEQSRLNGKLQEKNTEDLRIKELNRLESDKAWRSIFWGITKYIVIIFSCAYLLLPTMDSEDEFWPAVGLITIWVLLGRLAFGWIKDKLYN
jgi:hypothetical protein